MRQRGALQRPVALSLQNSRSGHSPGSLAFSSCLLLNRIREEIVVEFGSQMMMMPLSCFLILIPKVLSAALSHSIVRLGRCFHSLEEDFVHVEVIQWNEWD